MARSDASARQSLFAVCMANANEQLTAGMDRLYKMNLQLWESRRKDASSEALKNERCTDRNTHIDPHTGCSPSCSCFALKLASIFSSMLLSASSRSGVALDGLCGTCEQRTASSVCSNNVFLTCAKWGFSGMNSFQLFVHPVRIGLRRDTHYSPLGLRCNRSE